MLMLSTATSLLSSSRWEALATVNLSNNSLVQVPPMLFAAAPLRSLNLSNNKLRQLPMLPRTIETLNISNNVRRVGKDVCPRAHKGEKGE